LENGDEERQIQAPIGQVKKMGICHISWENNQTQITTIMTEFHCIQPTGHNKQCKLLYGIGKENMNNKTFPTL